MLGPEKHCGWLLVIHGGSLWVISSQRRSKTKEIRFRDFPSLLSSCMRNQGEQRARKRTTHKVAETNYKAHCRTHLKLRVAMHTFKP